MSSAAIRRSPRSPPRFTSRHRPTSTGSIRGLRPARVTVTTARGTFTRQADEALGSRLLPLDDHGLQAKFHGLVAPVLGDAASAKLAGGLWAIEDSDDVGTLVETMAKPAR